jgi:hypothetical protein
MGNAWIESEVCAENPTHKLGLQYERNIDDPWVRHAEELVKEILTNPRVKFDATILAAKIKDPYDSTLAEMESAVYLVRQGFEIVLEPTAPKKGPDIRADREGVSYFVEVRAAGFSDEEDRRQRVTNEIFAKLTGVPSAYFAAFTIGDGLGAGSPETRAAIEAVVEVLGMLRDGGIKNATFYYARPDGKVLLQGDGPFDLGPKASEIVDNADFIVEFNNQGKEMTGTPASLMKKRVFLPEPVKDDKRLRKILNDEEEQRFLSEHLSRFRHCDSNAGRCRRERRSGAEGLSDEPRKSRHDSIDPRRTRKTWRSRRPRPSHGRACAQSR